MKNKFENAVFLGQGEFGTFVRKVIEKYQIEFPEDATTTSYTNERRRALDKTWDVLEALLSDKDIYVEGTPFKKLRGRRSRGSNLGKYENAIKQINDVALSHVTRKIGMSI